MLMHGNKQIGFVYKGNKVINKIIKNGELIHEKGFTREKTDTTPIYFKGVGSNIKKYNIKGNSVQNGTPTPDTPVDIESVGKLTNICPYSISAWEVGHYDMSGYKNPYGGRIRLKELLLVKPNTTYYFDAFNTNNISFIIRCYNNSKTFVSNGEGVANKSTFTTGSNTYYLGITLYKSDSTTITYDEYKDLFENGSVKPFICLNSETNKDYYKYKIPVKMIGQNLFNKDDLYSTTEYSIDKEGFITVTCNNSAGTSTVFRNVFSKNLPLKSNTNYTIVVEIKKVEGNGQLYYSSILNNTGQFNWASALKLTELSNNSIFTKVLSTRNDVNNKTGGLRTYAQFSAGESGSITFRISVLADTTITTNNFIYKPYEEKITNIYLNEPLRKLGDYVDYIDFDDKKVVRNIKKDIITSSLTWTIQPNGVGVKYFLYIDTESKKNTPTLCNKLVNGDIWNTTSGNLIKKSESNNTVNIFIEGVTTSTDFKALLDEWESEGNPLYALLVLETPIEESIELPDIETFDGENNLTLDTTNSEMFIKYKSRV